ncbi:MAG: hypothetical protein HN704_02925 [Bacteroidetes bacterium]|jgi:hypothetical protein|nr:hypothetical protein [Bacteroidota bacterium]MBT6685462.1 hypothetical protein [Bacteroidota bacterium]MBT7144399.1 hypothetical protein [Bacteroidota bacterium]MBT7490541.1 hypothetical protein [Bacteroidota bacterium]
MKFIIGAISILAFFYLIFISIGFIASPSYEGEVQKEFSISVESMWDIIYDIDNSSSWRQDLNGIEILESDRDKIRFWLEYTTDGGVYANEIIELIPKERITIRIKSKIYGISGYRTYILVPIYTGCKLVIQEQIEIDEVILRSFLFFRGRDYYIKQQLEWLEEAI